MDKALELWKRLFIEWTDDPYEWAIHPHENSIDIKKRCFFCLKEAVNPHADNCIWIEAKKLVEENK